MGREEGGGFRMGNTCMPVRINFDIWQNQYNIVKLKNKINLKKYINTNRFRKDESITVAGGSTLRNSETETKDFYGLDSLKDCLKQ